MQVIKIQTRGQRGTTSFLILSKSRHVLCMKVKNIQVSVNDFKNVFFYYYYIYYYSFLHFVIINIHFAITIKKCKT